MQPTNTLLQNVDADKAKSNGAGPLLVAWARRFKNGLESNDRQIEALASVDETSPYFEALGGVEMKNWVKIVLSEAPILIDVLGLPYHGPLDGKDSDGNWFSPQTDFMDGVIDSPPVLYGHGAMTGTDTNIHGKVHARWYAKDGGWFKVELNRESSRFDQLYDAHTKGFLRASTGAVPATVEIEPSGHVNRWLVGELTLIDIRDGYRPANGYAITKANADDKLFETYYGDPVMETGPTLWERISQSINSLRLEIATWRVSNDEDNMAKCETCDEEAAVEAEKLRELITTMKAEQSKPKECLPCRAAISWVGSMVKANKMGLNEAMEAVDRFEVNADGWEILKDEVEARDSTLHVAVAKATLAGRDITVVVGNDGSDPNNKVDNTYMNRMRSQVNLGVK